MAGHAIRCSNHQAQSHLSLRCFYVSIFASYLSRSKVCVRENANRNIIAAVAYYLTLLGLGRCDETRRRFEYHLTNIFSSHYDWLFRLYIFYGDKIALPCWGSSYFLLSLFLSSKNAENSGYWSIRRSFWLIAFHADARCETHTALIITSQWSLIASKALRMTSIVSAKTVLITLLMTLVLQIWLPLTNGRLNSARAPPNTTKYWFSSSQVKCQVHSMLIDYFRRLGGNDSSAYA